MERTALCHCGTKSAIGFTSTTGSHPAVCCSFSPIFFSYVSSPPGFSPLSRLSCHSGGSSTNRGLVNHFRSILSPTPETGTNFTGAVYHTLNFGPGNKNQIIICSVYRGTAVITRKIIILTVLGGQAIFIAGLLFLIFFSCVTQLEVREERAEVENSWGTRDRGKTGKGAPEAGE